MSGVEPPASSLQRDWDLPLITVAKTNLIEAGDERAVARLRAAMSDHSGEWLQALPLPALGLQLSPEELRIAVALRTGCTTCEPHPCALCEEPVDELGAHGLSCRRSAGRASRHHAANTVIKLALNSVNVPSVLEPAGLARRDGRRPDGLSLVPWTEGRSLVWDFTCPDTLAATYVGAGARAAGAAATLAEARKRLHYEELSRDYYVAPVAVETLGSMGPTTRRFVQNMGKRLIASTGDTRAGQYFRQRLSVAIQRGNAASVLGTIPVPHHHLIDQ